MNSKVTREQIEDFKAFHSFDFVQSLEDELVKQLTEEINKDIIVRIRSLKEYDYPEQKKYKQVFSDIDPYGEEEWEV